MKHFQGQRERAMRLFRFEQVAWITIILATVSPLTVGQAADPTAQLDKTFDLKTPVEGVIKDVLPYLAERFELKIVIDKAAFQKENLEPPTEQVVKAPKITGISLDTTLRLILPDVNAVYEVRGNELVIVPNREGNRRRSFPPLSEQAKQTRKTFRESAEKIEREFTKDLEGKFGDILDYLIDLYEVPAVVDSLAFKKMDNPHILDASVKVKVRKGRLPKVFDEVLRQVGGQIEYDTGFIRIVPRNMSRS